MENCSQGSPTPEAGLWFEIRENEQLLTTLGVDIDRLKRGIAHLRDRFHNLTPDLVRYHAPGGMLAALTLFDINEEALYWLRTRQQMALDYMRAIHAQFDRFNRKVELGGIPRTATFSSLTGQNYQQMVPLFDYCEFTDARSGLSEFTDARSGLSEFTDAFGLRFTK